MSSARILILSNGALCRNPRVLKEATALGAAGHDVRVLTVRNHASSEPVDLELMRAAPFRREVVDLLKPGFGVLLGRGRTWLARKATRAGAGQSAYALGPYGSLLRRARSLPADLTIVHNEVAHCVGVKLLDTGRRVAADFEDWHSEDLRPEDRAHRPLELLRRTEQALLHRAVHVTTTSHALAGALHVCHGGPRPEVITNSFPLSRHVARRRPESPPRLFWFSQTLGPGRGLEPFLRAWSFMTQPSELHLLGGGAPEFRQRLLELVPPVRRGAVSFHPLVPPGELPGVIARHDIGLALEASSIRNRDLTITNKILQYLNAGLAIVASDTAGHREVLAHDSTAGIIVPLENAAAAARDLDAMLASAGELERRQAAARRLAENVYCWEREAPRLLGLVAAALAAKS